MNITEFSEETDIEESDYLYGVRDTATPSDFKLQVANLLAAGVGASIAGTPTRVGQFAVVTGTAYIATGTASSADWKQIT